jgi:hypothetical protein
MAALPIAAARGATPWFGNTVVRTVYMLRYCRFSFIYLVVERDGQVRCIWIFVDFGEEGKTDVDMLSCHVRMNE